MERRSFFRISGLTAASLVFMPLRGFSNSNKLLKDSFKFYPLPFGYNELEPYIDAQTMELHYDKHHRSYYGKFLRALNEHGIKSNDILNVFSNVSHYSSAVRNNGGGYYNHTFFWRTLRPHGGSPSEQLNHSLEEFFGSFELFKEKFKSVAKKQFGSGWAWLYLTSDNRLQIAGTPNQDNPLMDNATVQGIPLLCIDVWEHAYYLKYQNKRGDYIDAFWNVVNWSEVSERYALALKGSWKGEF